MHIFRNIIIAILVIVFIAGVGIYFLPDRYMVQNSIEINKSAAVVYGQISDFGKWSSWSPWHEMEPEAKYTVEGEPGKANHCSHWKGNKIGTGSMKITAATINEMIEEDLELLEPAKTTAKVKWKLEKVGEKTRVTWSTAGGLAYPFGRLWGLNADKAMGATQRNGLDRLKKYCEAIPAPVTHSTDVASNDSVAVDKSM